MYFSNIPKLSRLYTVYDITLCYIKCKFQRCADLKRVRGEGYRSNKKNSLEYAG